MNLYELLREAPIEDFNVLSNFKQPSRAWKPVDRRLLTHPKTVERVKNFFRNSPYDIRIWLVNQKNPSDYVYSGAIVTVDWLEQNMPDALQEIKNLSYPNNPFGEESINIIYTGNMGEQLRPMSPWIMAHRMGHAVFQERTQHKNNFGPRYILRTIEKELLYYLKDILAYYNGRIFIIPSVNTSTLTLNNVGNHPFLNRFLCAIGPSRACRENKLRNGYEFIYECFAKYLITGNLQFKSPEQIILRYAWGKPQYSNKLDRNESIEVDHLLNVIAQIMEQEFDRVLNYVMGKVMVM